MKTAKKSPHRPFLLIAFLVALSLLLLPAAQVSQASPALSPAGSVQQAWRLAQESGAYRFSSEIQHTTYPKPSLSNVGRSSHTEHLHLDGAADLPARQLTMGLWRGDGSLLDSNSGLEVRFDGDQAYGRVPGGKWQEVDDFSGAFAPDNDLMAYLAGAENIEHLGAQSQEIPTAEGAFRTVNFSRYGFDISGPALADYLRQQFEEHLRANGELPPGISLDTPEELRGTSGSGEIWIAQNNLPLRISVRLEYPQQPNGERVVAKIQTDFSNYAQPYQAANPFIRLAGNLGLPHTQQDLRQTGLYLTVLGFCLLLLLYRRTKVLYAVIVFVTIASMLLTPLLQGYKVQAFSQKAWEARQEREVEQQEKEAQEHLEEPTWDAHQDPLASNDQSGSEDLLQSSTAEIEVIQLPTFSAQPATLTDDDPGSSQDTDQDGITDADEELVELDPNNPDSDGDTLLDGMPGNSPWGCGYGR